MGRFVRFDHFGLKLNMLNWICEICYLYLLGIDLVFVLLESDTNNSVLYCTVLSVLYCT